MSGYSKWPKAEKIKWDDVSAERISFAPLPRWLYCGKFTKTEAKVSNNGNPMVSCQIDLESSYEDLVNVGRKKAFTHLVFTQKAAFKIKQLCEALSCDPPESSDEDDLKEFASAILDETVWFILRVRKNQNGEPDNEIEYFASEDQLEELAASLEPPGEESEEAPAAKSKSNGAKANGRRAAAAPVKEMDTEDDEDEEDEDDEDSDEDEVAVEAAPVEPRRRGRPPKNREARR